jgi:hypothetical protein
MDNLRKNDGEVVLRKRYFSNTLGVLLCKSSKEMIVTNAESGSGIHVTTNAWAAVVVWVSVKLKLDAQHHEMRRNDLKKFATLSCANADYNYLQQLTLTLTLPNSNVMTKFG